MRLKPDDIKEHRVSFFRFLANTHATSTIFFSTDWCFKPIISCVAFLDLIVNNVPTFFMPLRPKVIQMGRATVDKKAPQTGTAQGCSLQAQKTTRDIIVE